MKTQLSNEKNISSLLYNVGVKLYTKATLLVKDFFVYLLMFINSRHHRLINRHYRDKEKFNNLMNSYYEQINQNQESKP